MRVVCREGACKDQVNSPPRLISMLANQSSHTSWRSTHKQERPSNASDRAMRASEYDARGSRPRLLPRARPTPPPSTPVAGPRYTQNPAPRGSRTAHYPQRTHPASDIAEYALVPATSALASRSLLLAGVSSVDLWLRARARVNQALMCDDLTKFMKPASLSTTVCRFPTHFVHLLWRFPPNNNANSSNSSNKQERTRSR